MAHTDNTVDIEVSVHDIQLQTLGQVLVAQCTLIDRNTDKQIAYEVVNELPTLHTLEDFGNHDELDTTYGDADEQIVALIQASFPTLEKLLEALNRSQSGRLYFKARCFESMMG